MANLIYNTMIIMVSVFGAIAFFQIKSHGFRRWWTAIPFILLATVFFILVILPGAFLSGIIDG